MGLLLSQVQCTCTERLGRCSLLGCLSFIPPLFGPPFSSYFYLSSGPSFRQASGGGWANNGRTSLEAWRPLLEDGHFNGVMAGTCLYTIRLLCLSTTACEHYTTMLCSLPPPCYLLYTFFPVEWTVLSEAWASEWDDNRQAPVLSMPANLANTGVWVSDLTL